MMIAIIERALPGRAPIEVTFDRIKPIKTLGISLIKSIVARREHLNYVRTIHHDESLTVEMIKIVNRCI